MKTQNKEKEKYGASVSYEEYGDDRFPITIHTDSFGVIRLTIKQAEALAKLIPGVLVSPGNSARVVDFVEPLSMRALNGKDT